MKHSIQYIFLFLLVVFYGCETYYEPELEVFPDALVVEGMVTDQNDYAKIQLGRSASFNEGSYYRGERKATVSVESESGASYPASEIGIGIYQTNDPVMTKTGEGYYLKIKTSDGLEYRSKTEKMLSSAPIDSIYLTDTIFRELNYNYWGEPVVKDYAGITMSVLPRETYEKGGGFLYKWNALVNYTVTTTLFGGQTFYYCWKRMYSNAIYVYDYVKDDYTNELPLGDLHLLSFQRLSPFPIDSSRFDGTIINAYSSSFYYQLRQYAITKEGANFWRSMKNQSEASGKLFDPVEEQIIGNIYCVTDSSKVAFGFFNTASYSSRIVKVKITRDTHESVRSIDLMPIVESEEDCFQGSIPDFWF